MTTPTHTFTIPVSEAAHLRLKEHSRRTGKRLYRLAEEMLIAGMNLKRVPKLPEDTKEALSAEREEMSNVECQKSNV